MSSRATRTTVRSSKPTYQQHQQHYQQPYQHHQQQQQQPQQQQQQQQYQQRGFVSGGSVKPNNIPVVSYQSGTAKTAPQPAANQNQNLKPEMKDRDGDVAMEIAAPVVTENMDAEQIRAEKKKFFEALKKVTGVKKKPNKKAIQSRLRKHLTPKNATMALQEICPGLNFTISQVPGVNPPLHICEVEVNGQKHRGTGGNKSLARAACAERALQSFVKPPTKTTDAEGKEVVEDSTPWSVVAGFALHKLFCDWRQGRVGAPLSVEAAGPPAGNGTAMAVDSGAAFASDAATQELMQAFSAPVKPKGPAVPKQPKQELPADAATRHAVTLLMEMRPSATFDVKEHVLPQKGGTKPYIVISCAVDGKTFSGKGGQKKVAKRLAAQAANTALFGIKYPAEPAAQ